MIVISGALVLVALVLLVIGLVDPSLAFVYASIGVSLASFAFLVVGILQRRKEELPGTEAGQESAAGLPSPATAEGITAILAAPPPRAATVNALTDEPTAAPVTAQREAVSGTVLVVAGRPRYHVDGCRYLTGKDAEEVEVADAREEGFTACGVCKPDLALEAAQTTPEEPAEEPVAPTSEAPQVEVVAPVSTRTSAAKKTAAKAATAKAPAKAAATTAATTATKAVGKAPAKAAPTAKASTPAKKAAATPAKRGSVVVIPDRGKYHTPDCRYVRGAEGTLELTKAQATKQGYDACGVCNP
ncbi:MAG: hypothetical protein WCD35_16110 [Mycobacteriales bacterium]